MNQPGVFECSRCPTTVYSFNPNQGPPPDWQWDPATDTWECPQCQTTVLGHCPHGINLDREFCPHGCRI